MKIGIDPQLPPKLAQWIRENFGLEAFALRDLGLRDARDSEIFAAAFKSHSIQLNNRHRVAFYSSRYT